MATSGNNIPAYQPQLSSRLMFEAEAHGWFLSNVYLLPDGCLKADFVQQHTGCMASCLLCRRHHGHKPQCFKNVFALSQVRKLAADQKAEAL